MIVNSDNVTRANALRVTCDQITKPLINYTAEKKGKNEREREREIRKRREKRRGGKKRNGRKEKKRRSA